MECHLARGNRGHFRPQKGRPIGAGHRLHLISLAQLRPLDSSTAAQVWFSEAGVASVAEKQALFRCLRNAHVADVFRITHKRTAMPWIASLVEDERIFNAGSSISVFGNGGVRMLRPFK